MDVKSILAAVAVLVAASVGLLVNSLLEPVYPRKDWRSPAVAPPQRRRNVHFVGSMPFKHADMPQTMDMLLTKLDGHLVSMPDGEPKDDEFDRSLWIHVSLRFLSSNDAFDRVGKSEREDERQLAPKYPVDEQADKIQGLSYRHHFDRSYPVFKSAAAKHNANANKVAFQVGVPSPFAISIFTMNSVIHKFQYMRAIRQALAREINDIARAAGPENVVFQVEVPMETVAAFKPFGLVLPQRLFYYDLFQLIKLLDPAVRIGVHVCVGDQEHEAFAQVEMTKVVRAAQAIVDSWPRTHRLEFIHLPLAEAKLPPNTDPAFYEPISKLWIPSHTRLIGGFVHEKLDVPQMTTILHAIEGHFGRRIDVANSCGLGRVDDETARRLINASSELVNAA